jgi:hypothetical protein
MLVPTPRLDEREAGIPTAHAAATTQALQKQCLKAIDWRVSASACAALPASPPMSRNVLHFWGGSCSSSPPPAQQRSESLRNKNEIVYRRNGDVISKKGLCFDELLTELSALNNADNVGAAVDAVELIFLGQRLKEQQCEALASRISGGIFLKKVTIP